MKKSKKNFKYTTLAWVLAVMLLVVMIPVNIIADKLDIKLDMTPNRMYSLSRTTTDYINSMNKKVELYVLMTMETIESDDNNLALVNMLEQFSELDNIEFKDIDPNENPEIVKELNPNGYLKLSSGDIVVKCGENIKRIPGTSMYTYEGNEYNSNGDLIVENAYFQGENLVTGAIKSVAEGISPTIYFLTGHGEKALDESYTKFRTNLRNYGYNASELNLASENDVPNDAAVIIVPAPKSDISKSELEKLDRYMDKGGNISLLMSPNKEEVKYANFEALMTEYGIGMDYNRIYETDSSKHAPEDEYEVIVNLVKPSEDDKNAIDLTSALADYENFVPYMPASRSFYDLTGGNSENLVIYPLMETNESAVGEPYGNPAADPEKLSGVLDLAAYSMDTDRNSSKLVVMGNAEFIDDENVQEEYSLVSVYMYLSTISWMYNSDVNMGIPVREKTYDYMTLSNKSDANTIMIIVIAAPLIVAAAGVGVWLKRRYS